MVDTLGHVGMGLLWAIPAWVVWNGRGALVSIALVALAAQLPDIDRWLNALAPGLVHHHGVTHTVVFVVLSSVVLAGLASVVLDDEAIRRLADDRVTDEGTFVFVFGAALTGGLSHLFADMLSAPDIADPIEPFWPLFDKPWSVNLIWYDSPLWNVGLATAAVLAHVGVAYLRGSLGWPRP